MSEVQDKDTPHRDWTARQKLDLVLEGLRDADSVSDLCKKNDIDEDVWREWRDVVLEVGEEALEYGLRVRFKKRAGNVRFPTILILLVMALVMFFSAFHFYYNSRM